MSKQDVNIKLQPNQKDILDLERDYFNIFKKFFQKSFFNDGMERIKEYIDSNINKLNSWNVENKVALACERLVNLHIHKNFPDKKTINKFPKSRIQDIYPSPLSSDTAFITEDAIINIDCKTYSIGTPGIKEGKGKGNKNDWTRATIGANQTSFDQKQHFTGRNGSGPPIPVKFNLLKDDDHDGIIKPTISLMLGFLYFDNGKNFNWYTDNNDEDFSDNVKLACIPNGHLSNLFNNKIISNVKSYQYKKGTKKKNRVSKNAIGVLSFRVENEILRDRFDSSKKYWKGFAKWTI